MKLEKQVVNLELSKKLKELGVPQESLFYWTDGMRYDGNYDLVYKHAPMVKEGGGKIETLSAYTVAELGELCPVVIWNTLKNVSNEKVTAIDFQGVLIKADTEANARAKMLIYLLENELIEV